MEEDFQITVAKQTGESGMPSYHYHDYYEIYYLAAGERIYYIEDRSYPGRRDQCFLLTKIISTKPWTAANLDMNES